MRVFSKLIVALGLALLVSATAAASRADAFREALAPFAKDSYGDTVEAIEKIAALGDPRGAEVLRALVEGRLAVRKADKAVLILKTDKAADGAFDPVAKAPVASLKDDDIDPVRVNNRVRTAAQAALGRFGLASGPPRQRIAAARTMFRTPNPANLPLLEKAARDEKDPSVRAAIDLALAATRLAGDDKAAQLAGIAVLGESTDTGAQAMLLAFAGRAGLDPELKNAAECAAAAIENRLWRLRAVQTVFQGLSLGSVLLLAAIGLAITFGVMGVINMAHGEMVMIGAYTAFVVQQALRLHAPGLMEGSVLIAIPAAFLAAAAVGMALERGVIRFLYGRPLETLLMTWGVSMILQQAIRLIFGPTNREVSSPGWMTGAIDLADGISITQNRIWIIAFGLVVLLLTVAVTRRSWFGLQMRAVTQNRGMAASMGIRTNRIDMLTFGLGSGIAGMAGVALAQIDNVSPNLGQGYIVDSFMVVVFGGVGNLTGTLIGAMVLGIVNKLLEPYAGAVLGKIAVLVAIILFIQVRPRGMFALKGRAAEH